MRLILLCGGSGQRLWPLSSAENPKQFLRIFPGPNGEKQSMAERLWAQLTACGLHRSTVVCAGREHVKFLKEHLPEAEIVEEPSARNTFPAMMLACAYLMDKKKMAPGEPVVVLPIDPYVDEAYFEALHALPDALARSGADVVLMGKTPSQPLSKYGYILPSVQEKEYMRVAGFREKPEEAEAAALIASGALWNMGVFCFRAALAAKLIAPYGLRLRYLQMYEQYAALPRLSFDREVLEHSPNLAAVAFGGMWRDLGTWDELLQVLPSAAGQNDRLIHCENTDIINRLDIPIVPLGVNNLIIVATKDGILVTNKKDTNFLNQDFRAFL